MKTPVNKSGAPQKEVIFNLHLGFGGDGRCILIPIGQMPNKIKYYFYY
jgi:hypothetical protein